jgi:hypothetical protein
MVLEEDGAPTNQVTASIFPSTLDDPEISASG